MNSGRTALTRLMHVSGLLMCAAACALALQWSAGTRSGVELVAAAPAGSAPLGLTVTSASGYQPGEPIKLALMVTNRTGKPCALATVPEGTVGLKVARDGQDLNPEYGTQDYIEPVSDLLTARSQAVAPGASITVPVTSAVRPFADNGPDKQTLTAVTSAFSSEAVSSTWTVGRAGAYTLSVTYAMPGGHGACQGASDTATVKFTIAKPCPKPSLLVPGILGGLGGGGLLTAAFAARPVRRVVGRAALAGTMAAGTALFGVVLPSAAHASVSFSGDDPRYAAGDQAQFSLCTQDFAKPGHDPAGVLNVVNGPWPITVVHVGQGEDGAGDTGTGTVLHWNIFSSGPFGPGEPDWDPCSELYHELVHIEDEADRVLNMDECDSTGIPTADVRAVRAENDYRATRGLPPRKKYGTDELPPGSSFGRSDVENDCKPIYPPGLIGHNGHGSCSIPAAAPAGSPTCGHGGLNGDPHLMTFDGRFYDFQAVGEFVLAKGDGLEVQARMAPFPDSRTVSVATNLALRVGPALVDFSMDGDRVGTTVDGRDVTFGPTDTALPGGGTAGVTDDGFSYVVWPDGTEADIEPISIWGLRILLHPAAARTGKLTGLLGNDDGDSANDPVTSTGAVLPDEPSRNSLYGTLADTWRVNQATSILPYPPGTDTATFTDKSFPDKPITVADLDPGRVAAARKLCAQLGITVPVDQDACIIDLVLTGQPAFAASATVTEWDAAATDRETQTARQTKPGGVLKDGATAGATSVSGVVDTYTLDVGDATVVRLADVTGELGDSHRPTLTIGTPEGPDPDGQPGFTVTDNYQWRVVPHGSYTLKVSRDDGDTGQYSFRFVTDKDRRIPMTLGQSVSGSLDTAGRVDLYAFTATTVGKLDMAPGGTGCDLSVAVVADDPAPNVYTPHALCWDLDLAALEVGKRYLLIVWSDAWKTADYSFKTVVQKGT